MAGVIWAAISGIGFGLFQAFNRKAAKGMGDAYRATFILLLVSALILVAASAMSEDLASLSQTPPSVYLNFGLAGLIHFFLGWTFISISQARIGAARTGALVGAAPLFATVVGIIFFDEILNRVSIIGIATVIGGAYLVSMEGKNGAIDVNSVELTWRDSLFALGTAVCFASSAIFIRAGLVEADSPLLGVTVAMVISTVAYGVALLFRRDTNQGWSFPRTALLFQLLAGVFVGLSTWGRWIALDLAPVGIVIALGRLNVPVVLLVAPFLVGRQQERVTARIWLGAGLIIAGSLILIFLG